MIGAHELAWLQSCNPSPVLLMINLSKRPWFWRYPIFFIQSPLGRCASRCIVSAGGQAGCIFDQAQGSRQDESPEHDATRSII